MSRHQTSRMAEALPPRIYAEELTPSLQMALAALADIDFSHERDLDQLRRAPLPEHRRLHMAEELKQRRQRDRELYLRLLADLTIPSSQAA